jgi:hypothetical protein
VRSKPDATEAEITPGSIDTPLLCLGDEASFVTGTDLVVDGSRIKAEPDNQQRRTPCRFCRKKSVSQAKSASAQNSACR